jgi:hypothetical protein
MKTFKKVMKYIAAKRALPPLPSTIPDGSESCKNIDKYVNIYPWLLGKQYFIYFTWFY